MSGNETVSILVLVIGIGDDPGFGIQQTMGTIAGTAIAGIGFFLTRRAE